MKMNKFFDRFLDQNAWKIGTSDSVCEQDALLTPHPMARQNVVPHSGTRDFSWIISKTTLIVKHTFIFQMTKKNKL